MINKGYSLTSDTGFQLVFQAPAEGLGAILLSSQYDSTVMVRMGYSIAPQERGTRVVVNIAAVTNPGSAFERLTPMNGSKDSVHVQEWLNDIVRKFE